MSSETELQDLLVQLARFYRANETNISADQVSKCLELLPARESAALDRLLGLLLDHNWSQTITCPSSAVRRDNAPSVAKMASARASNDPAQEQQSLPILHATCDRQQRSLEDHRAFSSISGRDRDQQDMSIGSSRPEEFDTSSQSTTACSNFDQNTITTTPATSTTLPTAGETTTLHVSTEDDTFGTLKFAPMMKRLFQDCKTDRGEFLRAIREAKAAFPTGQGWEAAIATKEENADMRDRMKIYHRFECYNIYWHVVEAGFHTGTYWIRDMRTALANKLCQDFPKRFQNQKTANKCLNWVDQGCKYHEWAGLFSSRTTDLGYLIALPLDVPHSAYTSRCTKERMHAAALRLKSQGIDELVKSLELSELGNHMATTLRAMTSRKRKDVGKLFSPWGDTSRCLYLPNLGETTQSLRKLSRLMSGSSTPPAPLALAGHPRQNPTPPRSLAASTDGNPTLATEYSVDHRPGGHSTSTNPSRSIADGCAVAYGESLNNIDLSQSTYSGVLLSPGLSASLTPFFEWYQDSLYGGFAAN